jgi:hypothetical protein
MTRKSPGPSSTTASPMSGWWSSTILATSPRTTPGFSSIGIRAMSSGVRIGRMCWMPSRWLEVSMKPPVPGVAASM